MPIYGHGAKIRTFLLTTKEKSEKVERKNHLTNSNTKKDVPYWQNGYSIQAVCRNLSRREVTFLSYFAYGKTDNVLLQRCSVAVLERPIGLLYVKESFLFAQL